MVDDREEHLKFQKSFFDKHVDIFKQEIPEDVEEKCAEIVSMICKDTSVRILDVGTGCGALLKHYGLLGVPWSKIMGCDLSTQMLAEAKRRYPEVKYWQGDIINFPEDKGTFDLIVFNACFPNMYLPFGVLSRCVKLLRPQGRIAISHPLGNTFIRNLKELEPHLVLDLLPSQDVVIDWCQKLDLRLIIHRDEPDFYLALLEKN